MIVPGLRRFASMKTRSSTNTEVCLAAMVAAEDLQRGDFVAIFNEIEELPSFLWCCDGYALPREQLVQIRHRAGDDSMPLKIKALCLPFVFLKGSDGTCRTVDLRQCELVRLNRKYAKSVWRHLRKERKRSADGLGVLQRHE
jgi:hypothetical protein